MCDRWDDLQGEARRDAVARTHNVVFSQLASIAFNMLECGVDGARVRTDVTRKCRETQLGETQVGLLTISPFCSSCYGTLRGYTAFKFSTELVDCAQESLLLSGASSWL